MTFDIQETNLTIFWQQTMGFYMTSSLLKIHTLKNILHILPTMVAEVLVDHMIKYSVVGVATRVM